MFLRPLTRESGLRHPSHSRYGRRLLQENSTPSSTAFSAAQPSFIALICIIAVLIVAIIIVVGILCYRHCTRRRRPPSHKVNRPKKTEPSSADQAHVAASVTPSSDSSYSVPSSRHLLSNHYIHPTSQLTSSLGQSTSTAPSLMPSRRLQQSMIDAYLNDFSVLQPKPLDPKQLNSYLFIDLHSTSSETFPDRLTKQYIHDNTTTSGYDTSTGGEDKNLRNAFKYRRRRLPYYNRQRRRSTMGAKRSTGPRFLMRERSLPNNILKLPQLRQQRHRFSSRNEQARSSIASTITNTDLTSTATDDYDDSHAYQVNRTSRMKTIEEEKPFMLHSPFQAGPPQQSYFFEKVSTSRGDESDMVIYDDLPMPTKSSVTIGNGIAYVNDSIIV